MRMQDEASLREMEHQVLSTVTDPLPVNGWTRSKMTPRDSHFGLFIADLVCGHHKAEILNLLVPLHLVLPPPQRARGPDPRRLYNGRVGHKWPGSVEAPWTISVNAFVSSLEVGWKKVSKNSFTCPLLPLFSFSRHQTWVKQVSYIVMISHDDW